MGSSQVGMVKRLTTDPEQNNLLVPAKEKNPPEQKPSDKGRRFAKDVAETVEGFITAVTVQGMYQQFGPSLSTGYIWLDAALVGGLPVVLKHASEIVHDLTTNEGDFGHGLLSQDAIGRFGWNTLETVGGLAGGLVAQYAGASYLTSCLKPIAYIGGGVVGGFAGKFVAKTIQLTCGLTKTNSVAEEQEQKVAPEQNPGAGYTEPNTIQNIVNVFYHGIHGYSAAYVVNCAAKCLSYGIPNPLIQVGVQTGAAVVSRWRQRATSEKSFREQLGLPPTGGEVDLPGFTPINTEEMENDSQQLGTIKKYPALSDLKQSEQIESAVMEQNNNIESQQPQPAPQYASNLKATAKVIADTGVTLLSYGVGYVVVRYVCHLDESNDNNVDCRNAMTAGVAFVTEATLRNSDKIATAAVSGAKAVGTGVANGAVALGNGLATVGQGLNNGLSSMARMGMSMFNCARSETLEQKKPLMSDVDIRTLTPQGPGRGSVNS